jgi:hypothetical protein
MNNRVWMLGTAIASLAVIALGVMVGILPKLTEFGVNSVALATVQQQNQAYRADLAALKQQFENLDDVRRELEELRESLPADADIPDFIVEVNAAATTRGVRVVEATQAAPLIYGAAENASSDPGTAATPISGGTLLVIPYVIRVDAVDPLAAFRFMTDLRTGNRLLLITGFDMTTIDRSGILTYETNITLYLYTLVDPNAPVANGDADAPPSDQPVVDPAPTITPLPNDTPAPEDSPVPTDAATTSPASYRKP